MAQGKQARILTVKQEAFILHHLTTTRYPLRDRTMFLLSMKAGLRAKEMAALTWAMVTEADGQVGEALHLVNTASKGDTGGRTIPLHRELHAALVALAQHPDPGGTPGVGAPRAPVGTRRGAVCRHGPGLVSALV